MGRLKQRILQAVRLGDKIEAVTTATGIKSAIERRGGCSGCRRRKAILNGEQLTPDGKTV